MTDDTSRPPEEPMTRERIEELLTQGIHLVDALRPIVDQLGDRVVTGLVYDAQRALRAAHANMSDDDLPTGRPVYVVDGSVGFSSGTSRLRPDLIEVAVEDDTIDFVLVATPATLTAVGLHLAAEAASFVAYTEAQSS